MAKQFLQHQPPYQPPIPVSQPVSPVPPHVSSPQCNSVKVISEGSDSVSPTVSKAIAEWFKDE